MAVKLVHQAATDRTLALVGYEGGLTAAFEIPRINDISKLQAAQLVYLSQPHTQPILSLDASPDAKTYFTSSADAIVAAHRIPDLPFDSQKSNPVTLESENSDAATSTPPTETSTAQHFSSDPKHIPIPIAPATQETPLTFPKSPLSATSPYPSPPPQAGLSTLLASAPPLPKHKPPPPTLPPICPQAPLKINNTKHSGQQSLRVRSDGRLLVTGGWDTRIRIYSAKTLREVAVLKWHKEGVYTVAFSEVLDAKYMTRAGHGEEEGEGEGEGETGRGRVETGLGRLQRQREKAMQGKHWVVAGAKDGRVSLWEVF